MIDKYSKTCAVTTIVTSEFDSVAVGGRLTRLRTPIEFFDFDHLDKYPYQYMGEVGDTHCKYFVLVWVYS